jgi:hypothetical protein
VRHELVAHRDFLAKDAWRNKTWSPLGPQSEVLSVPPPPDCGWVETAIAPAPRSGRIAQVGAPLLSFPHRSSSPVRQRGPHSYDSDGIIPGASSADSARPGVLLKKFGDSMMRRDRDDP